MSMYSRLNSQSIWVVFRINVFLSISVFMTVKMTLSFRVPIFSFVCLSDVPVNDPLVGEVSPLSSTQPEE